MTRIMKAGTWAFNGRIMRAAAIGPEPTRGLNVASLPRIATCRSAAAIPGCFGWASLALFAALTAAAILARPQRAKSLSERCYSSDGEALHSCGESLSEELSSCRKSSFSV